MAVRAQERAAGRSTRREVPSFTVKVEDLKIVYRWIERYRKPQGYAQVFFDSIFMINFLRIFQVIGAGQGFVIEKAAKSQLKATIMIPITSGVQIGTFHSLPTFTMVEKVTRLGRHDAYVKPVGGELRINAECLAGLLLS
jgi:type II restriction enzyme